MLAVESRNKICGIFMGLMKIIATQRSRRVNKDFPRMRMGTRTGFPCVVPRLVANTRAKLTCFIAMPEISRAVFCLDVVQIARDAAARRDDAFPWARDPPSAPLSFPFFFSHRSPSFVRR